MNGRAVKYLLPVVLLSGCVSSAGEDVAESPATGGPTAQPDRVVVTESSGSVDRMQAIVEGKFVFIDDVCVGFDTGIGPVNLVRLPYGSTIELAGSEWFVQIPGFEPVAVGDPVRGAGGGMETAAIEGELPELPASCLTELTTQFYFE